MRESNFEMQVTNLNKEKAALKSQLDQTLEELMQVGDFSIRDLHCMAYSKSHTHLHWVGLL